MSMFQVEGLDREDYREALGVVKDEMEHAIQNRLNSLDKFKSSQQRRRRMSFVAPMNDKNVALDFEKRIAICKKFTVLFKTYLVLFYSR